MHDNDSIKLGSFKAENDGLVTLVAFTPVNSFLYSFTFS